MKVNFNLSTSRINWQQQNVKKANAVATQVAAMPAQNILTFGGAKNPDQVLLLTAETKPYFQKGGVATVVEQYPEHVFNGVKNTPIIMPYYNGRLEYDAEGNIKDVSILKKDGKPYLTKANLKKTAVDKIKPSEIWELEEVIPTRKMEFAGENVDIAAYKVKGTNHYMIYTKESAMMDMPYANGSYGSEGGKILGKNKDAYAKFNKAVAELLPDLEKEGINPKYIVLNDGQTGYFPEYIAQKVKNGTGDYYKDVKMGYVQHNLGDGYQQIQSYRNMFLNFATNDQIKYVSNDPKYIEALKKSVDDGGKAIEEYFKPMVESFIDADKKATASMIPIRYAQNGNLAHINTVSELYAKNALVNPMVAPGLTGYMKELSEQGKVSGILNGLSPSAGPENPIKGMDQPFKTAKGTMVEGFKTFNPTDKIEDIAKIRKGNKAIMLRRFADAGTNVADVAMAQGVDPTKVKATYGYIGDNIVKQLENGEDIKLFTSWGRGDLQKGFDNVLEAFEKIASTPEGKKSVLIMAGGLGDSPEETKVIKDILERMSKNPDLQGRYLYIDGFGNANAYSITADANIFPSRFAPCELTDLESMRYGASTIVTDIEGLAQKNFDVRDGLEKATGYKVKSNFHMLKEELEELSPEFKADFEKLVAKAQAGIDAKKLELELAGANTDCIAKMQENLMEDVLKSKDYEKLWRTHTDKQIVSELADAMQLKIKESPEVSNKLIRNTLDMKAMWENNDGLHDGVNKSSKLLYKERHLDAPMTTPSKPFFKFDEEIIGRAKKAMEGVADNAQKVSVPGAAKVSTGDAIANVSADLAKMANGGLTESTSFGSWNIKQTANNAIDSTKNLISEATSYTKNLMQRPLNKKIAIAAAGIIGLGTALAFMFKPQKEETKHASTYIA